MNLALEEVDQARGGIILVQAGHHLGAERLAIAIVPTVSMFDATIGIPFHVAPLLRKRCSRSRIIGCPAGRFGSLGADQHVVKIELRIVVDSHDSPSRIRS